MSEKKFDFRAELHRYTARLSRGIRSLRRRKTVAREYSEHIEDAVYARMLAGEDEESAFRAACEELGDSDKIGELLAVVHNRDRLPRLFWWVLRATVIGALFLSYIFIDDRIYRAWLIFGLEIFLIVFGVYFVCVLSALLFCLNTRRNSMKKLRRYAEENGLTFTVHKSIYRSIFGRIAVPEICIDTPSRRYILSLWTTFFRRRHLYLLDNGLYFYERYVGYAMLLTRGFAHGNAHAATLLYRKGYFPLTHMDLHALPSGVHLMPKIDWEPHESGDREAVRVLLLNPAPMKATAVRKGVDAILRDDDEFCGMRVYSTMGLISHLEGERIETDGSFSRKRQ